MLYFTDYIPETLPESIEIIFPEKRIQKAECYHQNLDRILCKLSYFLFAVGMEREYGIPIQSQLYWDIHDNGKPYLPGYPNISFNISHCKKAAFCGFSKYSIGVDVQDYVSDIGLLLRLVCTLEEQQRLNKSEAPERLFTWFWCLKEAYLKQKGTGLIDSLDKIDFSDFNGKSFSKFGLCFSVFEISGCCFSVCGEEFFSISNLNRLIL